MLTDRSKSVSPYNSDDDTWDRSDNDMDYSMEVYKNKPNIYSMGSATTEDSILKAFNNSSNMRDMIKDSQNVQHSTGRNFVDLQNKQAREESMNPNTLSRSIRNEHMVDEHYVGSLHVDDQFMAGTFKDRLGNEMEIWESVFPPADHDYTSTSDVKNDRHLQRLQGYDIYNDKKKTEVKGVLNPAELGSFVQSKEVRRNNLEFNNRDPFFNKNGLQPVQEFDDQRDIYNGYNWKHGHETRVIPVEHSWRSQIVAPTTVREASNLPEKINAMGLLSKKKEKTNLYAVKKANPVFVSAKSARLTLPIVSEATIRSGQRTIEKLAPAINQGNVSSAESYKSDNAVMKRKEDIINHPTNNESSNEGPVMFASLDHVDEKRQNDAIKPKPTKEWDVINKIREGIDHINTDDTELCEIIENSPMKVEVAAPNKEFDHIADKQLVGAEPTELHSQIVHGNKFKAETTLNESRQMNMPTESSDLIVPSAQSVSSKIVLNRTDVQCVENKRYEAIEQGSAIESETILKNEKEYINRKPTTTYNNYQSSYSLTKIKVPIHDRANYSVNRPGTGVTKSPIINIAPTDTNRNNENNAHESSDGHYGDMVYAKQTPKEEEENSVYIRTNARELHNSAKMESNPIVSSGYSGMTAVDRIHAPNDQDWRKIDTLINPSLQNKDERSTPCRPPSRHVVTPSIMTPSLSVESKRIDDNCNTRMTPTIHNQYIPQYGESSRD